MNFFRMLWFFAKWSLALVAVGLVVFLLWLFFRQKKLDKQLTAYAALPANAKISPNKNKRWLAIKAHLESGVSSEWRMAIIEADIIADELLANMGYDGLGVKEKSANVEQGDIKTIDKLIEANEGRNYYSLNAGEAVLTQEEAERIVGLYEQFFREVEYI